MLLNKVFKNKNDAQDVASAKEYVDELKFIHKPMIALNEKNKDALLTIFCGENDPQNLADMAKQIQDKCLEYVKIMPEASSGSNKVISNETLEKNRIAAELIKLNKELEKRLAKTSYPLHTSKYNAIAAFYPSSEFMVFKGEGLEPIMANPKSLQHSSVLSDKDAAKNRPPLSVAAPVSGNVYSHLSNIFVNPSLLVNSLRASALSTWSKYTNGRSVPVAVSWGLFLLALGIHPFYKLEYRKNTRELMEDPLFKDIFPLWNETFNYELWDSFKKYDLKPISRPQRTKVKDLDLVELRQEFYAIVRDWYAQGNALPDYATAEALIKDVNQNLNDLTREANSWKTVSNIILDLSNQKAFRQNKTRLFVIAFSQPHTFSESLDDDIFDLSSVATFLHLEANPSANIYTMLRYLVSPLTGKSDDITKLTGISPETWIRYDQGTRIPHSSAWTSIIVGLDLHPIYKVVKRTDKDEIEKAFNVYKDLHFGTAVGKKSSSIDFHIEDDMTFDEFYAKYF